MAITKGWCIEAVCDRCHRTQFLAYSSRGESAEEQLERRGWSVGMALFCPQCVVLREQAERASAPRARKRRGGRR